jgi:hypothetical protein
MKALAMQWTVESGELHRCPNSKGTEAVSPLLKGERVEVRRLAPEDACAADMLVQIHRHGRKMACPSPN